MAIVLFITLGVTLSLQLYLQYRHKLPSYKYEQHIQSRLDTCAVTSEELYLLHKHRDLFLYRRFWKRAMRFNTRW